MKFRISGRVPKWFKGEDRKSPIRWFESNLGLFCEFNQTERQDDQTHFTRIANGAASTTGWS
jgi:hypothetical protein